MNMISLAIMVYDDINSAKDALTEDKYKESTKAFTAARYKRTRVRRNEYLMLVLLPGSKRSFLSTPTSQPYISQRHL